MNLANKITISRIFLAFGFMYLLFLKGFMPKVFSLVVFIIASWTDFLDGFLAKKRNEVSDFGKLMDPIADKILVIAAFLAFVEMKLVPAWIVVIIVFREFMITGLRLIALTRGEIIEAEMAGKHKTVSQMISIYVILLFIICKESGRNVFGFWNQEFESLLKEIIFYMMVITALLTLISGISYLAKNKRFFINAKNK
ncbi:MAG: CDP-diacylglycerol--glycerol-3-phosphate 3-phosphatidyltransferase [Nitrospirae bacterium RBG_13_43_8]|nr:MAG: CDP-diacylglycerol--glycerol-3-phosphate 3-phosphatidyltransferase [Nitrospirae bacterium RBG_13_43_8]